MIEDTQERIANCNNIKRNVERMGRMNSEKLLWKSHVYIIQVEHKTKADKETDGKINSISLEMSLENRDEANEYDAIFAFGGGGGKGGILY